ncbi:hypothetical protein LAZ67_3001978, partial [Cordylochernes scorpioides]
MSQQATNLVWAGSPSKAEQGPVRHGLKAQPCAEISANQDPQNKSPIVLTKNQHYANLPAGSQDANSAAPVDLAAIPTSNAAAQVRRNWADITDEVNPGAEEGFTLVQGRKRRRGSADSPTAAAPSSNSGGARSSRRLHSSARSVPRAQEIPKTRTHITEARARQASSSEEHCVYLEHGPELKPFHYLRALDRLLGGTAGIIQISKVNGHQLLGLANRGLAERLINNGLEVEGTLLRAFPFRKRAKRITVSNLPFFVEDSAIINALRPFGRITSIAPKMMKAGPYTYTDGRREAFIVLHEGMTTERLPTRLDITIKGEAWPAYLSTGIKCSRCHGQGHRRANCPLLAGLANNTRTAPPTTPAGVPPPTTPAPPQRSAAQPPAPTPSNPAMEVCSAPPVARATLHSSAPRPSPPAAPAFPMEETPPAPPPVTPAPSLRTPGSREPAAPTPDVEMSIVEETFASSTSSAKNATRVDLDAFIEKHPSVSFAETDALGLGREEVLDLLSSRTKTQRSVPLLPPSQCDSLAGLIKQILDLRPGAASNLYKVLGQVKAELRTTPAAVPPTPPLPAPRPAEPMLPTTHREELTPPLMTPPPPAPTDMEEDDPITEEERCAPPPPAPRLAGPIPPVPHGDTTTPAMTTPPPPLSLDRRWKMTGDLIHELSREIDLEHTFQSQVDMDDIVRAVLYPGDREPFIKRLPTRDRYILSGFINTAIWRARDGDPSMLEKISANQDLQNKNPIVLTKNQHYANLPAGSQDANSAAPVDLAAIPTSNAAAQVRRNWADITEEVNPGAEEGFTLVQGRKRRRGSADSPTAAAPSSNPGGSRTIRRPQPSAHSVPRAQEIPTTRAHIAEARARQASSAEEHCVYLEHGPELQPFHYLRALDRLLGGTAGVVQVSKVNGHQLLGLANRGLAERLINNGLEVEGTLLRAFPFRKRAERITVGNLPFFVEDAAIIKALGPYGRITSIAPKMMKAGPYTYTDGRREAFIVLHEGVTTERLPTRLNITIKGEAWPAYLSSGIKCSRCHGQGHRRANCPLLAGRTTAPGPATPTSPTSVPPATAPRLPQQPSTQPPPPASPSPTMEVSDVPPTSRAALHPPAALRQSPPAPSALPAEDASPAPPPVTPAPSLRTPGSREPAAPTPDVEMSIVEETSAFSTSSAKNATRVDLDAFIEKHPSVSFAGTDALGLGREEVLDLLSSRTKAQRKGPLLSPPQCDALAGLIRQILDLRPGAASNLYKVLGQVKAELRTTPAAVPPTPPLPAPRPAEPMLPTTHREELTPPSMTPPPPAPTDMEEDNPMTEEALPAPRPAKPAPPAPHKEDSFTAMITPPPPLPAPMKQKDLMPDIDTIFNEMIVEPGSRPMRNSIRITIGNLPFFVGDAAVMDALSRYGRITSIAPKQLRVGEFDFTDSRREAFILLHDGITVEMLPARFVIKIKGETWPAFLTFGIKCSKCRGQGHRRANCPQLHGRPTTSRRASPPPSTSLPPSTAPGLPRRTSAAPPAPAPPSPAMEVCSAPPVARAVLHPSAPRPSSLAAPALPMEETPSAPPPVTPAPSLQAPEVPVGPRPAKSQHPEPTPPARPDFVAPRDPLPTQETLGPTAPTPDVEMSIVEETSASSTSAAKNATRVDLNAFIEGHPSVSFAETDAFGLGREEVLDLLSSRTKAQRKGPLLSPPQCDALVGLIGQILDLRPGAASNLYKVLGQVKAELRTTPAVPPTPPLPAPRPAEPTPPAPQRRESAPAMAAPPPPPSAHAKDDPVPDLAFYFQTPSRVLIIPNCMLQLPLKRLRFNQISPFSSNNKKSRNDIVTERLSRQDKDIMELNQDPIGVKSDGPTETTEGRQEVRETGETTAPLADAVTQLSALLTRVKISDGAEATIPPFDGTYSAIQFFQAFDRKMEGASMGEQEKLLRLPNYLVRQPLELFRKLRMADRSYFQVRQTLLDLYPESSEASFAKYFAMKLTGQANLETYYREKTAMGLQLGLPQEVILETLTEGLPFNDQRLVRVVPPENLGEWFRLVQRIHGPSVPTTRPREDQPPTMSGPYHSTPRRP